MPTSSPPTMPAPAGLQALDELIGRARQLVGSLTGVDADEALALYERFDQLERAGAAGKTLLAAAVAASAAHRRRGYQQPAELLAAVAGTSLGAARGELETSSALAGLPATAHALAAGRLSAPQGRIIADAAAANPGAERSLLDAARTANQHELRQHALRAKAAADPDPAATDARIHAARRVTRHTDAGGVAHLHASGPIADTSVVLQELDQLTDEIFRARGKAGTLECRDAYAFDALVQMARHSKRWRLGAVDADDGDAGEPAAGSDRPRRRRRALPPPEHLALLRVDVAALRRGHTEADELCEITGVGPVSLATARHLLGTAVLKLVLTNGVDVRNVTSLSRGPTQAMRYARLWTDPTCVVEGCSRTRVEYDHTTGAEYARTRHTRLDELDALCPGHHDLHTHQRWALVLGPPGTKRPMVPPDDPRHPSHATAAERGRAVDHPVRHPAPAEAPAAAELRRSLQLAIAAIPGHGADP